MQGLWGSAFQGGVCRVGPGTGRVTTRRAEGNRKAPSCHASHPLNLALLPQPHSHPAQGAAAIGVGGGWSRQQGLPGHPAPPSHCSLHVQVHSYESPRAPRHPGSRCWPDISLLKETF